MPKRTNNIKISDWLQYLEHISSTNANVLRMYLSFSSMAMVALLMCVAMFHSAGVKASIFLFHPSFLFVCGGVIMLLILFRLSNKPIDMRDSAEELLVEILIKHKYRTVKEIEKRWGEKEKNIRRSIRRK